LANAQTYEHFNFGLFNQINHARRHPGRFARYLNYDLDHRFPDDETSNQFCLSNNWDEDNVASCHYSIQTDGGREWYEATIRDLRHGRDRHQVGFVRWSGALAQQCYNLISQQGPAGHYGHIGEDGSTLRDRVDRYASGWTAAAEIITYSDRYGRIGSDLIKQLLLDDGIDTLAHRRTLLNPSWTHAGVSCGCHADYSMTCCLAFGVEVVTREEYRRPQVADQVNTCSCTEENFGSRIQHHDRDYEERHFSNYDLRLVHGSYDRGELSEVSYDSGPAQAVYSESAAEDDLGNSTLTFFPSTGRQHHSDQPDPDNCPYINTQDTTEAIGNTAGIVERLQIKQGGETENGGLTMNEIQDQADDHDDALIAAETTLGENIGNTTDTNDSGYTGVAVPGTYEHRGRHHVIDELNRARSNPRDYARDHYQEGDPQYDILMSHES